MTTGGQEAHAHLAEPTLYKHQDIRDPKAFPSLLPKTKTISFHILSKTLTVTRRKRFFFIFPDSLFLHVFPILMAAV